jgi:hypothetical protein
MWQFQWYLFQTDTSQQGASSNESWYFSIQDTTADQLMRRFRAARNLGSFLDYNAVLLVLASTLSDPRP